MRRRPRFFPLCQPNRGFLRSIGASRELGDEPISIEAVCALGLRRNTLAWLAREYLVCSSNAALYIFHGRITDPLARMARKHPDMTAGLTTALWLAGVLDERPPIDHWMIADARHRPIWLPKNVRVHRSRNARDDTFVSNFSGAEVRVHLPLRATLDCIRFRAELGDKAVANTVKTVLATGAVDLPTLLAHAKHTKVLRPLLELLNKEPEQPEQPAMH
jgi:hypothetical protein